MGLDQYLTKGKKNICPHCGEVANIEWRDEEEVYWRKFWELHYFIDSNIHTYGKEEYGQNIEMSIDDLKKIRNSKLKLSLSNEISLEHLIKYLEEDELNVVGYSADW